MVLFPSDGKSCECAGTSLEFPNPPWLDSSRVALGFHHEFLSQVFLIKSIGVNLRLDLSRVSPTR